jgi:hypothetical protein
MTVSIQILTLMYLWIVVSANSMVRVLFNNGTITSNENCTAADNLLLDALFNTTYRRHLRLVGHEQKQDRQLYPLYCKNYCLGYVKGTCRATNCVGYRRQLSNTTSTKSGKTTTNVTCPIRTSIINATLNSLVATNAVSTSCRNLLSKPRQFQCYENVQFGEVEYIKVYDKRNVTINEPNRRLTICNNESFRVEVEVNECVDELQSVYQSPKGNFTFPPSTRFPFKFIWYIFPGFPLYLLGDYTFQYIPDGIEVKSKTLLLNVRKC